MCLHHYYICDAGLQLSARNKNNKYDVVTIVQKYTEVVMDINDLFHLIVYIYLRSSFYMFDPTFYSTMILAA